ncbi:MAG TPA: TonB family protein [Pyrinomonadaceae bacterium]|nr:TonB family protein [Pyrinomonadaceae bacterium]
MFTNLIESESHRKEFKRRSSFFLATVAAYALILFAAGVASIYAYDARLEAQSNSLEILNWVPPVPPTPVRPTNAPPPRLVRRTAPSNAPVDRTATVQERTTAVAPTNDPTKAPEQIGVTRSPAPPVTGVFRLSNRNVDPPSVGPNNSGDCVTCNSTAPVVRVEETAPVPIPVKPKPQTLTSIMLVSKAISLPKPAYPPMAKAIGAEGSVAVQILVDEQGRVISAQAVSGHPTLLHAAKEAALQARFTPTVLNGQPVKIQGVITYNFVLH